MGLSKRSASVAQTSAAKSWVDSPSGGGSERPWAGRSGAMTGRVCASAAWIGFHSPLWASEQWASSTGTPGLSMPSARQVTRAPRSSVSGIVRSP